jgi:hypothetical protein
MSERFTIELSSEKAQYYQRIAQLMGQSVESLIIKILEREFFINEPFSVIQAEDIPMYSNAQLWAIVEKIRLSGDKSHTMLCIQVLARLRQLGYDVDAYIEDNKPLLILTEYLENED